MIPLNSLRSFNSSTYQRNFSYISYNYSKWNWLIAIPLFDHYWQHDNIAYKCYKKFFMNEMQEHSRNTQMQIAISPSLADWLLSYCVMTFYCAFFQNRKFSSSGLERGQLLHSSIALDYKTTGRAINLAPGEGVIYTIIHFINPYCHSPG